MKILALADVEDKALWDFYDKKMTEGVDLIISCGDLHPDYLQYIVTMTNVPLLYVRGNHDRKYDSKPPLGCIDIDDKIYDFKGLRIMGLGGSIRYHDGKDMYTEAEMLSRIRKMKRNIALHNGFDILVTHAPAEGYGDLDDLPHHGFGCFNYLMNRYKPKYMLHGHVHKEYGHEFIRERTHESGTKIINCYDKYYLEVSDDEHPARGKTGSFLYDLYTNISDGRKKY